MLRKCILALMIAAALIVSTSPSAWAGPSAKDRREAQTHLNAGIKHLKKEAWTDALTELEASLALHDTPSVRFHLGKALVGMGKLIEAREHLRLVLDNKRATWWQKKNAKDLLKNVEQRLAHLTIEVPPGFAGDVSVDDDSLAASSFGERREVNPGTTVVRARAEGFLPFEQTVVLNDGDESTIKVTLKPEPKAAPAEETKEVSTEKGSTRKTLGYVSLAVGGVGLIAGTAFGLAARGTREDLRASCLDDVCAESQRETYDRGKLQANISTAGFIAGGVGVGLGALLLLTGPSEQESERAAGITPFVGPASAGVRGRF